VIEDRDLFERAIRRFPPPESSFDRLIIRRARKRRKQRLAAGAVGLTIIALAAVLVFTNIIRADRPVPIERPPLTHNGDITVFGYPGGLRSLSLDGRHERSLVRCQGSCTIVSSAAWSPNGMEVAFSPTCAGGCGTLGDPYHGIRVVDLANGDDRLLVSGDFFSPSLDWSPDGSRLSYVADGLIHVVDLDGSNPAQVPGTSDPVVTASWSPDGRRFVYASGRTVSVIGVDGSDPTLVVPSTRARPFSPVWSPDGEEIAYRAGCSVWVTTPDGVRRTRVAQLRSILPRAHCGSGFLSSDELVWSPDGQQMAVLVEGRSQQVLLMQADGSHVRLLSKDVARFSPYGLAWQPVE
jgi:dipeptidyl aminopeptidase/acylaminoacyl peptidase